MRLLIDTERPFSEEERQAVISIQSRFRTYQAQNHLDQARRGPSNQCPLQRHTPGCRLKATH